MCILIVKPANVKTPTNEIFENCFDSNPDGAGFSFSDGRKLFLSKGHMSFRAFKEALQAYGNIDAYPAIFHFRIATHGTVKPGNTHPFNVNDRMVAGHNGILRITPREDLTDSETFFKDVCSPVLTKFSLFSKEFDKMVTSLIDSSKLAFLTDSGEIKMFGKFIEDSGVFYSNTTYTDYCGYRGYSKKWDKPNSSYNHYYDKYHNDSYDSYDDGYDSHYATNDDYPSDDAQELEMLYMYDDLVNFGDRVTRNEAIKTIATTFDMTEAKVRSILGING